MSVVWEGCSNLGHATQRDLTCRHSRKRLLIESPVDPSDNSVKQSDGNSFKIDNF